MLFYKMPDCSNYFLEQVQILALSLIIISEYVIIMGLLPIIKG